MWKDCQALQDEITALRRELHQIPEVGAQLPETGRLSLRPSGPPGYPFRPLSPGQRPDCLHQGGLRSNGGLRADMDALPHPRGDRTSFFLPPPRRDARLRA